MAVGGGGGGGGAAAAAAALDPSDWRPSAEVSAPQPVREDVDGPALAYNTNMKARARARGAGGAWKGLRAGRSRGVCVAVRLPAHDAPRLCVRPPGRRPCSQRWAPPHAPGCTTMSGPRCWRGTPSSSGWRTARAVLGGALVYCAAALRSPPTALSLTQPCRSPRRLRLQGDHHRRVDPQVEGARRARLKGSVACPFIFLPASSQSSPHPPLRSATMTSRIAWPAAACAPGSTTSARSGAAARCAGRQRPSATPATPGRGAPTPTRPSSRPRTGRSWPGRSCWGRACSAQTRAQPPCQLASDWNGRNIIVVAEGTEAAALGTRRVKPLCVSADLAYWSRYGGTDRTWPLAEMRKRDACFGRQALYPRGRSSRSGRPDVPKRGGCHRDHLAIFCHKEVAWTSGRWLTPGWRGRLVALLRQPALSTCPSRTAWGSPPAACLEEAGEGKDKKYAADNNKERTRARLSCFWGDSCLP